MSKKKALCIKSITIDTGLLITIMPHRSLLFTQWTLCENGPKDLLFQAECSQEAKESKFLLVKIEIITSR